MRNTAKTVKEMIEVQDAMRRAEEDAMRKAFYYEDPIAKAARLEMAADDAMWRADNDR